MKQKTSGLHVGKYREKPNFKTNLAATILPAVLIFCALAGLFLTATGSTSLLPLFASGLVCFALFAAAKHFRKEAILLPAALVLLIIIVCFARGLLLNGFAALWNEARDLWAAEQSVLLPLAQTDSSGRWLAAILLGLFLAALSLALSRVPTLAATLLILFTVAAGLVQITPWLLVSSGIALLLLAWQKNTVSAVNFLLLGAVVLGIAALTLQTGTMQRLSQTAKDALHRWRYETSERVLPEGKLSEPVPSSDGTATILSVTSDKTDTLYLRGFVGDTSVLLHVFYGRFNVVHVVQGIEDTHDAQAALNRITAEAVNDFVRIGGVSEEVAAGRKGRELRYVSDCLVNGFQAGPGIFVQVAHYRVGHCAAPNFHGVKVRILVERKAAVDLGLVHSCSERRLLAVTQRKISDF